VLGAATSGALTTEDATGATEVRKSYLQRDGKGCFRTKRPSTRDVVVVPAEAMSGGLASAGRC
jgi:hypothetical protein